MSETEALSELAERLRSAISTLKVESSLSSTRDWGERLLHKASGLSLALGYVEEMLRAKQTVPEGLERLQAGLWLAAVVESEALPADLCWVLPDDVVPGVESVYGYDVVRAAVAEPMLGLRPR
jgi:hypothetical protein